MQGGSGLNSVPPPGSIDKTRVLDVKPLRSLKPIFPPPDQAPNYVQAPLNGPYPAGYSPFFPFATPQPPSQPPVAPTPLRSFRTPEPTPPVANGDVESSMDASRGSDGRRGPGRPRRSSQGSSASEKRSRVSEIPVNHNFVSPISLAHRDDGNREMFEFVMISFDALRRRLSQLEECGAIPSGVAKRPDLKAANMMMTKGLRTNQKRRIGSVPGVEVGDIFYFRMELCVVGLHAPSMAGIDYLNLKGDSEEDVAALSIVSSGYYDDDAGDENVLIYSGQGGGGNAMDKEAFDQKLERGNLALEKSLRRGNEVRVIRGMRDGVSLTSKVYMFDGLYTVQESWMQKGKSGTNIFKYKLVRVPEQRPAFGIWKSIEKWKEGLSTRPGLLTSDLASGAESTPVTLVNEVDTEKGPGYFTYFPSLRHLKPYNMPNSCNCKCRSACSPGDLNCSCNQINKGDFPYTGNGILVSRKPIVYECGPSCQCFPGCKNRVSQTGLKIRLEVFKTKDRGWGLRSWDPIRAGTFICEFAGEVIDKSRLKQRLQEGEKDEYIFDTSRDYEPFKWNEPGLLMREGSDDPSLEEVYNIPSPLVISAKSFGNVARFMNHSCCPNVFWQPIIYEDNSQPYMHIAFFAMRHIPPMTELTYDYGVVPNEGDATGSLRKKTCLCGFPKCRGFFGL